ncbi:hypothetical protein HZC32_01850 [Candidatus Woesearchaeota archaeon]|nr:hypothetical protein [Candidatus Woesearchaeota archaeon]
MVSKRGAEMSLNVIIVAVIALVVLVVLIAIFTGRITIFQRGVSEQGDTELTTMRITYGQCAPALSAETKFKADFAAATTDDAKDLARSDFGGVISQCKASSDETSCKNAGCKWS